jgi:hypothetical protein
MPKRRRFAAREELEPTLAARDPGIDWVSVLATLTEVGVDIAQLVKVVVNEEV